MHFVASCTLIHQGNSMEAYGGHSMWKGSPCDFDLWDLLTFMSMYYVSQEPTGRMVDYRRRGYLYMVGF